MFRRASFAVAALALLVLPTRAAAAERNPFTEPAGPPGHVLAAAHFGSQHRDGYGLTLGVAPVPWMQVEVSAGYYYELSLGAVVRVLPFPRGALTPFVSVGANRAVSKLSGGLRYTSVSVVGAIGLQTRVAGRWFLGAEVAMLYEVYDSAKIGSSTSTLSPDNPVDFVPGAFFGVYFL